MPDAKISALTAVTTLTGDDLFVVVDGATTKKITTPNVRASLSIVPWDFLITVTGSPNTATYRVVEGATGVTTDYTDTGTTSGLKAALTAIVASHKRIQFGPGRFHFLDSITGVEAWAGTEDRFSWGTAANPLVGVSIIGAGMTETILSNRSNWSGAADTEPLSFTNAQRITIRDLCVESTGSYKSTTDAIDFDQGSQCLVERVMIRASRARGIVFDGGDNGKNSIESSVRDCIVQGCPEEPGLRLFAGGSLTATTVYRYAVSWVCQDLGGAGVSGETKVGEVAFITTDATNKQVSVTLPIGPYGCTARKIYRSTSGSPTWVLVATQADNTTLTYTDIGGAGTGVTMPVSGLSTVPAAGIEVLGSNNNLIHGNAIIGVGDGIVGAGAAGINIVRKGSGTATVNSDNNRIIGNTVRFASGCGIRLLGANRNLVIGNHVSNCGTVASRQQAIRIDGATSATTNYNVVSSNALWDDQDANSPPTGKTISTILAITATTTPTGNQFVNNIVPSKGATATPLSDLGTTSIIRNNTGDVPLLGVAAITVTASPFTVTAGGTPEVIYVSAGTVSGITKGGVTLGVTTPACIPLAPGQSIVVTYSVAPTMARDQQ